MKRGVYVVPNWIRRQEITSSEPRWVTEYGSSAEEPSIDESRLIEEYTAILSFGPPKAEISTFSRNLSVYIFGGMRRQLVKISIPQPTPTLNIPPDVYI